VSSALCCSNAQTTSSSSLFSPLSNCFLSFFLSFFLVWIENSRELACLLKEQAVGETRAAAAAASA
jgi:hypothetical protein